MNTNKLNSQSIIVVDDHVLFRDGLVSLFDSTPDFHVVGQAGTVQEGVEKAFYHKPDIILMDYALPDGTGLEAAQTILDELPDCKIIFLTVYETDENLMEAMNIGAMGYLLKNVTGASLLASLRALAQGEIAMSRKMMSKIVESSRSASVAPEAVLLEKLSPRELEILCKLKTGASNAQIAGQLFLSENTVKHHVRSILEKLEVDNRYQAGRIAQKLDVKKLISVN